MRGTELQHTVVLHTHALGMISVVKNMEDLSDMSGMQITLTAPGAMDGQDLRLVQFGEPTGPLFHSTLQVTEIKREHAVCSHGKSSQQPLF